MPTFQKPRLRPARSRSACISVRCSVYSANLFTTSLFVVKDELLCTVSLELSLVVVVLVTGLDGLTSIPLILIEGNCLDVAVDFDFEVPSVWLYDFP